MESPGDWVTSLAFTPDGSAFWCRRWANRATAVRARPRTLAALWDVQTGERLRDLAGHTNVVTAVAISPDGRTVLTGSADYSLRVWDIATGRKLAAVHRAHRLGVRRAL